ncbi:MAG: sialate O-acetylesterase [Lentisphaerae bacterium]|nr:sialate O-acetylesterase [Lentisphaerota bacterium]
MDLYSSLMNSAVLQRNANNVSDHSFQGTCSKNGKVYLTVQNANGVVPGFEKAVIGNAEKGKVSGKISGLPVGGPYELTLSIGEKNAEKCVIKDVLVGDLWILAGQSNMADSGYMPSCSQPEANVHAFYMTNEWGIAKDPLHDVMHAVAPVHGGNPNNPYTVRLRGTGPGLPFGIDMYKATGVPQGLIACAHGGTSLAQWSPALKNKGGYSLYGAFYERMQNLGGRAAGLLWYQGCNDTGNPETVKKYEQTTRKLFAAFRRDCHNPDMPIVLGQLGSFVISEGDTNTSESWLKVRQAQYHIGQTLKNTACVPAIDLPLDDSIHLSNQGVTLMGRRMAEAMQYLRKDTAAAPQIMFKEATCLADKVTNNAIIKVKFGNVQGQLTAPGLACGFCVVDKNDNFISEAINVRLDGDCAYVQTRVSYLIFSSSFKIAYGGTLQPHANITDEAGRSLPCFAGKVRSRKTNISEILQDALISEAIYCDDSFEALQQPEALDKVKFMPAKFNQFYLPCPREAGELDKAHKVYCYKFRLRLQEDMELKMLFGADAAFVIHLDGKEFTRVCTTNPVILDEFKFPLQLSAGEHEFVCTFSSNSGCGWGICCRFMRMDGKVVPEFVPVEELA